MTQRAVRLRQHASSRVLTRQQGLGRRHASLQLKRFRGDDEERGLDRVPGPAGGAWKACEPLAVNRSADGPLIYTTLARHANKGYSSTDGANTVLTNVLPYITMQKEVL